MKFARKLSNANDDELDPTETALFRSIQVAYTLSGTVETLELAIYYLTKKILTKKSRSNIIGYAPRTLKV